jgi:ankyrin repeat protein
MRGVVLIAAAIVQIAIFPALADDALDGQLLAAAKSGTAQQVEALIGQGAKIEARSNDGWTPLRAAIAADNRAVVAALLAKAANANAADKFGITPLMAGQSIDVVKLLIDHHADVNARSNSGNTPLIMQAGQASKLNYPLEPRVELLLAKGADVNATDKSGRTALMAAAALGRAGVVRVLLKHGAKATARNAKGVNALDMTMLFAPGPPSANDDEQTKRYYEIQKLLRAHGAAPTGPVTVKLPGR